MAKADFNLSSVSSSFRAGRRSAAVTHAGIAIAVTLAFLAFHAVRAFPSLADSNGDNDSLLRLVQVRDLLAGQSWFDLTQYRMGLDGGFVMHWSRLIDLPIAGLVLLVGEQAALVIWPLLLLALSLFLMIRAADLIGGAPAVLPAVVTGALALHFVNVFLPGALDHHNAQLALALGAAYALMVGLRDGAASPGGAGGVAGVCAALMLAIGMEAAPYAAVACAVAAGCYLAGGDAPIRLARGFGLAFAGAAAASFVATVPSQDWLAVTCDALSLPQGALAVLGGGGLALATLVPVLRQTVWTRLGALAALGVIVALVAISAFPQCLADPYADLDPVLRQYWLSSVTEAQPLGALVRAGELGTIAGYYATPVIALTILALQAVRGRLTRETAVLFAFLAVAVAVSCWQVRGGVFSVTLAAIVLAAWIGRARTLALARPTVAAQLVMAASWIVSISLLWQLAGVVLEPGDATAATETETETEMAAAADATCYALADHAALAQLPAGTVLTISNLGSTVLHETAHRVLNGPYHRNNAGNRAALDILMVDPDAAATAARGLGIDYVALCPGNAETQALARWAPDGFLKALLDGATPDWLAVVEGTGTAPLRIFQVRR